MKISISIPDSNLITNHGYGQASFNIVRSLQRLGHQVPFRDPTAPVEINISQPNLWVWSSPNSYKIGMVAWESTKIPENWKPGLSTCDELWTPSPLIATWLADEGYPVTQVYQHGVDSSVWAPKLRTVTDRPIRFLHIGEPALRKGGQLTFDAFTQTFSPGQATLTIKAQGGSNVVGDSRDDVFVIKNDMSESQLVKFVHDHDVLVYPSYGEGFGLIPLQALSTGMPVIISQGWAPYERLPNQSLLVKTELKDSPWPDVHPGKMFHPDPDDLVNVMLDVYEDFEHFSKFQFLISRDVHEDYDWDRLTEKAFADVVKKFDS